MAIPFITIELDKPRRLRMGMGATVQFERATGKKLQAAATELMQGDVSMLTIAQLLHAMLQREEPGITLDAVCDLVDDHADRVPQIARHVVEAINAAYEDPESPNAETPTEK